MTGETQPLQYHEAQCDALRILRENHSTYSSCKKLGDALGVSHGSINNWERGISPIPGEMLAGWLEVTGTTPKEFHLLIEGLLHAANSEEEE